MGWSQHALSVNGSLVNTVHTLAAACDDPEQVLAIANPARADFGGGAPLRFDAGLAASSLVSNSFHFAA
jgi:hypothetical protein